MVRVGGGGAGSKEGKGLGVSVEEIVRGIKDSRRSGSERFTIS